VAIWAIQCKDGSFDSCDNGVPSLFSSKREAEDYRTGFCWPGDRSVKVTVFLVPGQPKAIYGGPVNNMQQTNGGAEPTKI
jgi:hypothetical protein